MASLIMALLVSSFFGLLLLLMATYFTVSKTQRPQREDNNKHHTVSDLETELQKQQAIYDILFAETTGGIAFVGLEGSFFQVNPAFCEILGYNHDDLLSRNFFHLMKEENLHEIHYHMQLMIDRKINTWQKELSCLNRRGENLFLLTTISIVNDANDDPAWFIVQAQNITGLKIAEEKLKNTPYQDTLTGLSNKNKFEQELQRYLALSQRHDQRFGLMYIDLDRFGNIAGALGNEASSHLLQVASQRIKKAVRNTDVIARVDEDEFAILLEVKRTESIAAIAEKVLAAISRPVMVNDKEYFLTASIGISVYPEDGSTIPQLMKNADAALYRAKNNGRNNYQFFNIEISDRAREKLALQKALSNALLKNEFVLNYQPVMEMGSRKMIGVEALIRWKNKEFGLITPAEIISLTEESGLIIRVSEWVLKTACTQLVALHNAGYKNLTMSINCSEHQFKQSTFMDDLLNVIKTTGIPPQCLELELTEHLIMDDPDRVLCVLRTLKDLGVKIVIDDFGAGYWSWDNLLHMQVDKIKIDKKFIRQVTENQEVAMLVSALIALINRLGIVTVAEGVETRQQYEFLLREGCQQIQGYYISQPVPENKLAEFLKNPVPEAETI